MLVTRDPCHCIDLNVKDLLKILAIARLVKQCKAVIKFNKLDRIGAIRKTLVSTSAIPE